MANNADPDQLAFRSQLIWIYTVCKGRVYPGSAGQGLKLLWTYQIFHLPDLPRLPHVYVHDSQRFTTATEIVVNRSENRDSVTGAYQESMAHGNQTKLKVGIRTDHSAGTTATIVRFRISSWRTAELTTVSLELVLLARNLAFQLPFFINLQRAVIDPSATLTGR